MLNSLDSAGQNATKNSSTGRSLVFIILFDSKIKSLADLFISFLDDSYDTKVSTKIIDIKKRKTTIAV